MRMCVYVCPHHTNIKYVLTDVKRKINLVRHIICSTFLGDDDIVCWRPSTNWSLADSKRLQSSKSTQGPYDSSRHLRKKTEMRVFFDCEIENKCSLLKHLLGKSGPLRQRVQPICGTLRKQFWPVHTNNVVNICKRFRPVSQHHQKRKCNAAPPPKSARPRGVTSTFAKTSLTPMSLQLNGDAKEIQDLLGKRAICKRKEVCRLTTEIGQSILKAHIQNAGLPADTQYMSPDLSALGFTASLDYAVWGTKERLPLMVTMGQRDDLTTLHHFCVKQHNNAQWDNTKSTFLRACIEQNISRLKFTDIWVC